MVGSPFHRHTRGGVGRADPPRPVGTRVVVELGMLLPEDRVVLARHRGLWDFGGSPLQRFDRPERRSSWRSENSPRCGQKFL